MAWSLPAEAPNSWTAQARQARHWQHGSCAHGGRLASLHLCPWRLPHTSSAQTTEHRRRVWTARSTTLGPKPVLTPESRGICSVCGGTGHVACKQCQGSGWLQRGGFNRKNPVPKNPISSKWTAMEQTIGWRHFRCIQVRKSAGATPVVFLLMQASCDSNAQLWVNREMLRDRSKWSAGWLQMSEMPNLHTAEDPTTQPTQSDTPSQPTDSHHSPSIQDSNSTHSIAETGLREAGLAEGGVQGGGSVVQGSDSSAAWGSRGFAVRTATRGRHKGGAGAQESGAKPCKLCAGTGRVICKSCDASGVALIDL